MLGDELYDQELKPYRNNPKRICGICLSWKPVDAALVSIPCGHAGGEQLSLGPFTDSLHSSTYSSSSYTQSEPSVSLLHSAYCMSKNVHMPIFCDVIAKQCRMEPSLERNTLQMWDVILKCKVRFVFEHKFDTCSESKWMHSWQTCTWSLKS